MLKNIKAFTLIEILVAIALLAIIWLWFANYNFSSMWDRQTLESFTNKIISNFETLRTNALVWKWAWENFVAPEYREISFSTWNNWFETSYYIKDKDTWELKKEIYDNFVIPEDYSIEKIICTESAMQWLDNWLSEGQNWIIRFEWNKYSLLWDCDNLNTYQKVSFKIKYKDFTQTIEFNAINWLIERTEKN